VLQTEDYGLRRHVDALCGAEGFEPVVALEGRDLTTLFALIAAGTGIGLFPTRPAPPDGVEQVSLSPRVNRRVGLLTRPEAVIPAAARDFAQFIRANAPALAAQRPGSAPSGR